MKSGTFNKIASKTVNFFKSTKWFFCNGSIEFNENTVSKDHVPQPLYSSKLKLKINFDKFKALKLKVYR